MIGYHKTCRRPSPNAIPNLRQAHDQKYQVSNMSSSRSLRVEPHAEIFICFLSVSKSPKVSAVERLGLQSLTLPSDLVQKVHHDFVLSNAHTIEVLPHSIRQLIFALPTLLFSSCHCRRHMTNWGSGEDKLIVRLIECGRCV